jgi:hypothetical protein
VSGLASPGRIRSTIDVAKANTRPRFSPATHFFVVGIVSPSDHLRPSVGRSFERTTPSNQTLGETLMNPIIVGVILFVLWLFLPARKQAPGESKRTPKWKIIFRLILIPFAVVAFWGAMFCIADVGLGFSFVLGGAGAVLLSIAFLWAFTNIGTFLSCPKDYRLWKSGGGDPWFDTLDPPFNNDSDATRYQELYREKARQEWEEVFPPPTPPDPTKGIDDPNVI